MTLRDTDLIGKHLVKIGFSRCKTSHYEYHCHYNGTFIEIKFIKLYNHWKVLIKYRIDASTDIVYDLPNIDVKTIYSEADKLVAIFKFMRL